MKASKKQSKPQARGRSLHPVVLHPCPFCGAAGNLLDLDLFRDQHGIVFYIVRCGGCLCDGPIGLSKEGAATVWNVRFAIMQNTLIDHTSDTHI
jgi:hypothetical protein